MEQVLPFDERLLSQQYRQWQTNQGTSIFAQLDQQAKFDIAEQEVLVKTVIKEMTHAPIEVDPEPYHNCLNCHVKFTPHPDLLALYNVHCSPNCALRSNLNFFQQGGISGHIYQAVINKIEDFFGLDGIEPFPPFQTYRGTIWQYHSEKPLPPDFAIAYYDRRDLDEFVATNQQDGMEVESNLLSEC
jgi:hypothetical protein